MNNGISSHHARKTRPSLRRYGVILLYAILGLACGLPLAALYNTAVAGIADNFSPEFYWLQPHLHWIVSVFVVLIVSTLVRPRLSHFRNLFRYPPALVAVWLAFALALGTCLIVHEVLGPSESLWGLAVLWPAYAVFAGLSLILLMLYLAQEGFPCPCKRSLKEQIKAKPRNEEPSHTERLREMSTERILEWITNEAPVSRAEDDLLNAVSRARDVLQALQIQRVNHDGRLLDQTAVIQGPFGAGKTTIVEFLEQEAKEDREELKIIVRVNCWGFSSVAAQEHVLEQALQALSRHVDCMALRGIPAAYANALEKTNSWLTVIAESFSPTVKPSEQLAKFTPVLEAINARLIIIIEDTDRNGVDFDQKQIEAMLHAFREVERASFVLTAGLKSDIEFPKIAEHIEWLSPIPPTVTLKVLQSVCERCRQLWRTIDPTTHENRVGNLQETYLTSRSTGQQNWAEALGHLIDTPRLLKAISSAVISRWKVLHGEVDLDELIMVTALRHAAPGVFTFLGTHISELRQLPQGLSYSTRRVLGLTEGKGEQKADDRVVDLTGKWRQVVEKSGKEAECLGAILVALIPTASAITGLESRLTETRVQGINSERGAIYWGRLTNGTTRENVPDQSVLEALTATSNSKDIEGLAVKFAASQEFAELVLFFGKATMLAKHQFVLVAQAILQQIRTTRSSSDVYDSPALALLAKWAGSRRNDLEDCGWEECLKTEIAACFPENLRCANAIYFELIKDRFFDDRIQSDLRSSMRECAHKHYSKIDPLTFARAFDSPVPYTLKDFLAPDGKMPNPSIWTFLGPSLLEGMKARPDIFNVQVVFAFGESGPRGKYVGFYNFDLNALKAVFPDRESEVYSMLSVSDVNFGQHSEYVANVMNLAQAEARKMASTSSSATRDS